MRVKILAACAVLAALASTISTNAQYPGMLPLTGQFDLTGRTVVDPPPSEPRDTHFRVYLTGEAARALFENMKVDSLPQACGDNPERSEKRVGSMLCSTDYQIFECFFAINIKEQTIEGGWAC